MGRVKAQGDLDPDTVFGPIPQCSLERIFRDPASVAARANRAWRPRGSSNDRQKNTTANNAPCSKCQQHGWRAPNSESRFSFFSFFFFGERMPDLLSTVALARN